MISKRPDHEIYIKIGAYIILGLAFLFLIFSFASSVSVWIIFASGALFKKIISSLALVIAGSIIFLLLLALYEFLMEFLTMEEEVEVLEEQEAERSQLVGRKEEFKK